MEMRSRPWQHELALPGALQLAYASPSDGRADWALCLPPAAATRPWVVHLHGHGSTGDQLFTRDDLRQEWLPRYQVLGLGVLSPNLRGNAWMCPEAVGDLHFLLDCIRRQYAVPGFILLSGSMGGTGNLIYAVNHPEDVVAVAALCPVTDIVSYHGWCVSHPGGVRDEIRLAIESAYGGSPTQVPERYHGQAVTARAARLTMPVLVVHACGDATIPVAQARALQQAMTGSPDFEYIEVPDGNHDTPLHHPEVGAWLRRLVAGLAQ